MAIYTQFGDKVKVFSGDLQSGEVDIVFDDGEFKETNIAFLKADGGLQEIILAIKEVSKKINAV